MAMRIQLDGKWDAAEFAEFFSAMNEVYQYYLISIGPVPWEMGPKAYFPGDRPFSIPTLKVERISFASPGFTDLAGLAAAIREVREFIQFVIHHLSTREDRTLERAERRLSLAQKRVDLLRSVADLDRDYPGRHSEMSRLFGVKQPGLPDIDPIIHAIEDQRLVGVIDIDKDPLVR
jgi:hypothetical protein